MNKQTSLSREEEVNTSIIITQSAAPVGCSYTMTNFTTKEKPLAASLLLKVVIRVGFLLPEKGKNDVSDPQKTPFLSAVITSSASIPKVCNAACPSTSCPAASVTYRTRSRAHCQLSAPPDGTLTPAGLVCSHHLKRVLTWADRRGHCWSFNGH